jgi:hypothetical protein
MVDVKGRCAALFLLIATACGAPAAPPSDVVRTYFRSLGRDPMRTLPLVTDAFHRRHALRVVTSAEAQAAADRAPDTAPNALALDRHQLGWLAIQSRPELARLLAAETTRIGDAHESGDTASVDVEVAPRDAPAFAQRFALVRGAGGAWRIDAIEQSGVVPANAASAFAAYPNEAARRALAARPAR